MLSVFNIVRLSFYAAVCLWSLIVLGLAVHLENMLISNDLTRFIPLAIFISVCTLLIIPTLLFFGFIRRQFLIQQTRVELGFVGLLGLLWFILGIYTATGKETEVECDMDGDGDWEDSDEFTDTFHAQYHTIEAFSIFNAILLFAFFFLLLLLAIRQRRQGNTDVWVAPVTQNHWFGATPPPSGKGLPEPITSGKGKKTMAQVITGTFGGNAGKDQQQQQPSTTPMKAGGHYIIYIPPPPART